MKLIDALALDYPQSSKRTLLQWIRFGRVLVKGDVVTKPHHLLEEGVSYSMKEKKQEALGIPILYRDQHIIVIDKPAGLLSIPAKNHALSALQMLGLHFKTKNIMAVHRLDQDTSGVMMFVWGQEVQATFDPLFAEHQIKREYLAIVEGRMAYDVGSWNFPLKELESYEVVVDLAGKEAITNYEVLKRSRNFSYLRLNLETGRKHQIRVHCKEAGHPILGDKRYGTANARLYLHAHRLAFTHPYNGKEMIFTCPLPSLFKKRGFLPCLL